MAEYKSFPLTWPWKLADELADIFINRAIKFSNNKWTPQLGGVSSVNFLQFQNGKEIGTQGFMMSVALEGNIFLQGVPRELTETGFFIKRYESDYHKFNTNGNMQVFQLNQFTTSMRKTAEKILENNRSLLPDSITIKSTSRDGTKEFIGEKKSSDWGDSPLKKQATLNATNTSTEPNRTYNEPPEHTERRARLAKVWSRPNQKNFSNMIRAEYKGTCIITGCTTQTALEAAHIIPFADGGADTLENGLLLRADLHRLFDANLMAIDPDTGKVHFKDTGKHYNKYDQKIVDISKASQINLTAHWQKYNE